MVHVHDIFWCVLQRRSMIKKIEVFPDINDYLGHLTYQSASSLLQT